MNRTLNPSELEITSPEMADRLLLLASLVRKNSRELHDQGKIDLNYHIDVCSLCTEVEHAVVQWIDNNRTDKPKEGDKTC